MTAERYDIQQLALQEAGADGERVVWCGQPDPIRMAWRMVPLSLFSVPWTAFAIFWVYAASGFRFPPDFSEGGVAYFPLFGTPFVLIGFGMFLSPFYQYSKAFRTIYIVTNVSVRIMVTGTTKKVQTYSGTDLASLQRSERRDGSGDLIFRREISYSVKGGRRVNAEGFYGIKNVRAVEQHIAKLRPSLQTQS